jgi:hypothetical protein
MIAGWTSIFSPTYLRIRKTNIASKSPSDPHTTPAMVPKCSSRLMRITESLSVARGANVRRASQPEKRFIRKPLFFSLFQAVP